MPATSVDVTKYILGHAEIYYRDAGVLTDWTSVGLTMDDAIARFRQTMSNPSNALNGIDGMLRGLDYRKGGPAEIEFTLPELSAAKLALALPGIVTTTGSIADATVSPYTSTLATAAAIGDTNIKVAAVAGATVGDYIRINVAGVLAEYRRITFVGTLGAGGTGLGFRDPLLKAHANGVAVVESLGDGHDSLTPSPVRRQPPSAYKDWAVVTQSPADYYAILLYRAMASSEAVELSFTDDVTKPAGFRVTLQSRKDETNLLLPDWEIRPAAA